MKFVLFVCKGFWKSLKLEISIYRIFLLRQFTHQFRIQFRCDDNNNNSSTTATDDNNCFNFYGEMDETMELLKKSKLELIAGSSDIFFRSPRPMRLTAIKKGLVLFEGTVEESGTLLREDQTGAIRTGREFPAGTGAGSPRISRA